MEGLFGLIFFFFNVGGRIHSFSHLCWNVVPMDPNTLSRGNGEENCLSVVGHVTGDKK